MDKCDTCIAARAQGELPACVRNCAGGALRFGDLDDPESEVSRLLASVPAEKVHSLRDFGNGPSIRYILRRDPSGWTRCPRSWKLRKEGATDDTS